MYRSAVCARLAGGLCFCGALLLSGCLDRPVVPATPRVTARFTSAERLTNISKIDLLFMIDNSQSMSDKQSFLALAVPDLLAKLINPVCVDADGREVGGALPDPATRACPPPTHRDFDPVSDIHVGIISSSLGGHGAPGVCPETGTAAQHNDDKGHLLTRGATGTVATFRNGGFLNWNPGLPEAFSNEPALRTAFASLVSGVGQDGCGYESQLEAVYRFLNDPSPYERVVLHDGVVDKEGIDQVLLKERADFLRPDSLVLVISITDENDYSIVDGGQGFLVLSPAVHQVGADGQTKTVSPLKGGTSICKSNPSDVCCYNCGQTEIPRGCPGPDTDPECRKGFLPAAEDDANLRASRSKLQYGIDFANPVERYIEGFSQPVLDRFGGGANNPLYSNIGCVGPVPCAPARDPSLVFFAGIVGVPWQDIAIDPADPSRGFQDAKALLANGTWDVILGNPEASPPALPGDAHMIVSVDPRPALAGPDSPPGADPKHGHEWDTAADSFPRSDLQYACNFELTTPRDCQGKSQDCDCVDGLSTKNPLCQNPTSGAYGTVQFKAKAYPGVRELQVLKGIGDQAIVASICPPNTRDPAAADFGYRPVMNTVLDRLRGPLRGRCLPRPLEIGDDGNVPCIVMEAFTPPSGQSCNCQDPAVPGRVVPSAESLTAEVAAKGPCVCEIRPLAGDARAACERGDPAFGDESGWCYIDPLQSRDKRQCDLVSKCLATERRILRYFGAQPRDQVVVMCQEPAFSPELSPGRRDVCAKP